MMGVSLVFFHDVQWWAFLWHFSMMGISLGFVHDGHFPGICLRWTFPWYFSMMGISLGFVHDGHFPGICPWWAFLWHFSMMGIFLVFFSMMSISLSLSGHALIGWPVLSRPMCLHQKLLWRKISFGEDNWHFRGKKDKNLKLSLT